MRPLSVPELLNVWEGGLATRPFERALAILAAASPECSRAILCRLSIGRRDAGLLRLREWAFGPELPIVAMCPSCQHQLETALPLGELCAPLEVDREPESCLEIGEYRIRYRPPATEDLMACTAIDMSMNRRILFNRCVLESNHLNNSVPVEELPAEIIEAAIQQISEADESEILIDLSCPNCEWHWHELFDIVSFFWMEIDAWARRLLREVHILASAYGWKESDILALSPVRREIYLAMAKA